MDWWTSKTIQYNPSNTTFVLYTYESKGVSLFVHVSYKNDFLLVSPEKNAERKRNMWYWWLVAFRHRLADRQTDRTTDWLTHTLNRRKQDNNQRHRQQQMTHRVGDEDGRQERWLTGTVWSKFYWKIPRKQLERRRIPTRLKNSRHFLPTPAPVPGSQNYKDDDGRIVLSVYKELSLKLH